LTNGPSPVTSVTIPMNDHSTFVIEFLEVFHNLVKKGITPAGWAEFLERIEEELSVIADERIRKEALEIFFSLKGGSYVFSQNPEMKDSVVLPSIQKLVDFLKSELK